MTTSLYQYSNTVELQWLEHQWLVYHGLFELIFGSLRNFSDSSRTHILGEIFLFYYEIVCCVYSLESPHRSDSNECTQHNIILLKVKNISINYRHLFPDLVPWLNLIDSNYPSLEHIYMVPKIFEPLKFDCTRIGWYKQHFLTWEAMSCLTWCYITGLSLIQESHRALFLVLSCFLSMLMT